MKMLSEVLEHKPGIYDFAASGSIEELRVEVEENGYTYFYLDGSDITTKETFLNRLADMMGFPSYFGHNWDALYDCLIDLMWLTPPRNGYFIVYEHPAVFSHSAPEQYKVGIDILEAAIEIWAGDGVAFYVLLLKQIDD